METKVISTIKSSEISMLKNNKMIQTKYSKLTHEILGQIDTTCPGMIPTFLVTSDAEKELAAMRKNIVMSVAR